jgi:lipopolysaccharide transport system permease protein
MFFLGSAIGLLTSMISVVAFDLDKILNMLMGLLLYITPVIYSNKISNPFVKSMIRWNPLTYLVCSARDLMIYGRLYNVTGYVICAVVSVLLFLIAWRLFYVSEHQLIERMI